MNQPSTYSSKVLELVAKEVSGYFTGNQIVKILEEFGLKRDVIQYPNTKWWTINEAFKYIKQNYEKPDDSISKLIMDFLHPLQHNLNSETSEKLADKVEKYLKYDNFYIENTGKEYLIFSSEEMDEIHTIPKEVIEQDKDDKKQDEEKIKNNAELIKTLRDNHQSLMDVVEIFCQNSKKPTKELNDAYLFLVKRIENLIKQLDLKHYKIYFYKPFNKDIYTAEYEWNGDGSIFGPIKLTPKLSWDAVRPHMYETHSKISEIYRMTEETEEMSDDEKQLEQINALISEKRTQKESGEKKTQEKTVKIEISKMPELKVKNIDDNIVVKNTKRITLPKFPRTEWSKVSITFLGDRDVLLSDGKDTKPSSFQGLGCEDGRNGRPDETWKFLLEVANGNGQSLPANKKERESKKKQKQKITDILRKIFQNDSEPFENETGGIYRTKFNIKYNAEEKTQNNKYSDLNEAFSEMTEL